MLIFPCQKSVAYSTMATCCLNSRFPPGLHPRSFEKNQDPVEEIDISLTSNTDAETSEKVVRMAIKAIALSFFKHQVLGIFG